MLKISFRQIVKEAGPKEKKRARGINFDHVKSLLSGVGTEVSRQAIDEALVDEKNLAINSEKLGWIESLNLSDEAKSGRLSEHESYLLIVGAAITSNSLAEAEEKLRPINTYFVTNHEIKSGSFNLNLSDLSDIEKIKSLFNEKFKEIKEWEREQEELKEEFSENEYLSNEVVHDFGDGWKVVYVPAVGEMEPFPGLPNTSHDRILEGNKNGLCLGSKSRSHQDNLAGKIYSVRDPSNKPGVTIRIMDNRLEEAKGKDNAAPSADYATHAMKWFKTVPNLYYKSNDDVRKFPPTSASLALNAFRMDKDSPYKKKWISSWYNKGIPELDEDVQKRVRKNDPRLFRSGLGKKYKELVEPVVKYWCNAYLNDSGKKNILFGGDGEVYKTYKKTPEMIAAVEKLASEEPQSFMNYDLVNYPEYAKFSDFPIRNLIANSGSIYFLSNNAEKEWAKPYLDDVIKNAISMEPDRFFKLFNQKDWAKPYLEDIKIPSLRKNPIEFITFIISSRESMATYGKELEGAINAALVESPHIFLKLFSKSNFARPHIQTAKDNIIKEIKENKKMRESRAREICNCVGEESFIKERNAQLNGNSAYGILGCYYFEDGQNEDNDDEDFADDFISKESSAVRVALVKLAKALSSLGLPSESKSIFKI